MIKKRLIFARKRKGQTLQKMDKLQNLLENFIASKKEHGFMKLMESELPIQLCPMAHKENPHAQ